MKKLNKDYSALENTAEAYIACTCENCSSTCFNQHCGTSENVQASAEAGVRSNMYVHNS